MKAKEWLLKLKKDGVLIEGTKYENQYLHLQTPCKVILSDTASSQLRDSYRADQEKGGLFLTTPKRINEVTHLTIDRAIFLTNVADTPQNSYRPDGKELSLAIKDAYAGETENSLPIHFQTLSTHSGNPMNELLDYIFQCKGTQHDELVSDIALSVGELNVLMPRSLVICDNIVSNKICIGFYNGLIAPIEFEAHEQEQTQKAIAMIEHKVQETGGTHRQETIEKAAERLKRLRKVEKERELFLSSQEAMIEANKELSIIIEKLKLLKPIIEDTETFLDLASSERSIPPMYEFGFNGYYLCFNSGNSMQIDIGSSILKVILYEKRGDERSEDYKEYIHHHSTLIFDRDLIGNNGWSDQKTGKDFLTSDELIDKWIKQFITDIGNE